MGGAAEVDASRRADDTELEDDDEPDECSVVTRDQRINATGCAKENMALTDCHAEKKDWRQCVKEMQDFKECWSKMNNDKRTEMK